MFKLMEFKKNWRALNSRILAPEPYTALNSPCIIRTEKTDKAKTNNRTCTLRQVQPQALETNSWKFRVRLRQLFARFVAMCVR